MKLSEIFEFLFEGTREDFVIKQMGSKLIAKYAKNEHREETAENIVNWLSQVDPSTDKSFLSWIARMYANDQFQWHDLVAIKETLQEFMRVKNKLLNKDLNSYKSVGDLRRALEPFEGQEIISKKQATKQGLLNYSIDSSEAKYFFETGQAELFYRGSTLNVVIPKTEKASCFFGMNTTWCTARKDENNKFDHYNKAGPLYTILCENGLRFQFHFPKYDYEFMDKHNAPIDFDKTLNEYPELLDAFNELATKLLFLPLIKNQTEEICLAAVQKDGRALKYVKQQTPEICLAAVNERGIAVKYVKNQTEKICLAAVRETKFALRYIEDLNMKQHIEDKLGL